MPRATLTIGGAGLVTCCASTSRALPVKGLAHITGGGLLDNVPRILGESLAAELDSRAWPRPELFGWLQREGNVADAEMHRVFNCGIGMVVVVAPERADQALTLLRDAGENAWPIGTICRGTAGQAKTLVT